MRIKRNEAGAASLITVIFISLILMIVTVGFIRLAVREQRTASDNDLTNRAFFAAEAGVEDAKQAIRSYLKGDLCKADLNEADCAPATGFSGDLSAAAEFNTKYSCQLIDLTPDEYTSEVSVNETVQAKINAVNDAGNSLSYDQIKIRWHHLVEDGVPSSLRATGNNSLPNVASWNYPAMLMVQFFSHPNNFTSSDLDGTRNYVTYLNPINGSGSSEIGSINPENGDGEILEAKCDVNGINGSQYACEATITGFDATAEQKYMRLTSLYTGTNISVTLWDIAGTAQRNWSEAQAVVDVTGQSSDVYRRVQTVINLGDINVLPSPSAAITSGSDICKNFLVTNQASDSNLSGPTSCAP